MTAEDETGRALDEVVREPDDLDGHTIDELAAYLDAGRVPPDPSIESSAACRHALDALERLRAVAAGLLEDGPAEQPADERWVDRVMSRIALDAHAGADVPLGPDAPDARLVITEGALRALIRATGDDEPAFLVGRVRFPHGLPADADPAVIAVEVTVLHGVPIRPAVEALRRRVTAAVLRHTAFRALRADIAVQDLHLPAGGAT